MGNASAEESCPLLPLSPLPPQYSSTALQQQQYSTAGQHTTPSLPHSTQPTTRAVHHSHWSPLRMQKLLTAHNATAPRLTSPLVTLITAHTTQSRTAALSLTHHTAQSPHCPSNSHSLFHSSPGLRLQPPPLAPSPCVPVVRSACLFTVSIERRLRVNEGWDAPSRSLSRTRWTLRHLCH